MSWINSRDEPWRTALVGELEKYMNITRIGKIWGTQMNEFEECKRHSVTTEEAKERRITKQCVSRKFKFNLALENSIRVHYVTEKFWDSLFSNAVTVYFGAPNVARDYAPAPDSFINIAAFPSCAELATYLQSVANDEKKWLSFFKWRSDPASIEKLSRVWNNSYRDLGCNVAQYILQLMTQKEDFSYNN